VSGIITSSCSLASLLLGFTSSFRLPGLQRGERCAVVRRVLRSSTSCVLAPQASWPRPQPLASLRSWLPEWLSSPRGVLGPSQSQRDRVCSERCLPGAYAKHLISLLGDAFLLRVSVSGVISCRHEPQISTHASALLEAVGIFQGEHERKRRKRPNPLDLSQELRFGIMCFGDLLQLSVVVADTLC
jgi:hypothetical protein